MTAIPDILAEHTKEEIIETLREVRYPVEVAICGSDNYFNTGSIIRTCHNFLVRKIYLVETTKFYKKATMGAHKYENIVKMTNDEFVNQVLVRPGKNIIAFERRPGLKTQDIRTFKYPENPILVFGSEKDGCSDAILNNAQSIVSVPVNGINNDFNISVAASIALYDWFAKHTTSYG